MVTLITGELNHPVSVSGNVLIAPDNLEWAEVINALENPARLKNEYERRCGVLEKEQHGRHDTTALKRQVAQLTRVHRVYSIALLTNPFTKRYPRDWPFD